jgi:hypothetical protein
MKYGFGAFPYRAMTLQEQHIAEMHFLKVVSKHKRQLGAGFRSYFLADAFIISGTKITNDHNSAMPGFRSAVRRFAPAP